MFDELENDEDFIVSWTFRSNRFISTTQTLPENVIKYEENKIITINSGIEYGSATLEVKRENNCTKFTT